MINFIPKTAKIFATFFTDYLDFCFTAQTNLMQTKKKILVQV